MALESASSERANRPRRAGGVARGVGGRVGGGLAVVRGVRSTTVGLERAVRRGALVATARSRLTRVRPGVRRSDGNVRDFCLCVLTRGVEEPHTEVRGCDGGTGQRRRGSPERARRPGGDRDRCGRWGSARMRSWLPHGQGRDPHQARGRRGHQVTRGSPVRTARFMASRILVLVEHPAATPTIAEEVIPPGPAGRTP